MYCNKKVNYEGARSGRKQAIQNHKLTFVDQALSKRLLKLVDVVRTKVNVALTEFNAGNGVALLVSAPASDCIRNLSNTINKMEAILKEQNNMKPGDTLGAWSALEAELTRVIRKIEEGNQRRASNVLPSIFAKVSNVGKVAQLVDALKTIKTAEVDTFGDYLKTTMRANRLELRTSAQEIEFQAVRSAR